MEKYSSLLCFTLLLFFSFTNGQDEKSEGLIKALSAKDIVVTASPCDSNPCQNGGTCISPDSVTFLCICSTSCSGTTCQTCSVITTTTTIANNPCSSNPCQNGGTCISTDLVNFICSCPTSCSGSLCQTCSSQNNGCSSSPCKNGATCSAVSSTSFICTCTAGCYGFDCSYCITTITTATTTIANSLCSTNPCKNGGTCSLIGTSTFQCTCPSGCVGYDCSYCYGTTATTKSPSNCADFSSYLCQYYAGFGYCTSNNGYINGAPFRTSCPVTCNSCTTTKSPSTCVDQQANCVYWANYCNLIPSPNPCPKTCKLC